MKSNVKPTLIIMKHSVPAMRNWFFKIEEILHNLDLEIGRENSIELNLSFKILFPFDIKKKFDIMMNKNSKAIGWFYHIRLLAFSFFFAIRPDMSSCVKFYKILQCF